MQTTPLQSDWLKKGINKTELQVQGQSLPASLYDGSLSLGCTDHFGQTAAVKRRFCLAANYARRFVVSVEITVRVMPCSNLRLESSP